MVETKVMLKDADVHGQVLDHLGLVASVIHRLKLVEKIDARLKVSRDKGAKVTMGQRLAAMILNGLGFIDDRLYLFPEFLRNKPIERLLGKGVAAEDFNDDALGRFLDAVSDYGVTPLFSEIALDIGLAEGLLGRSAHFDTTSINVFGEYAEEEVPLQPESLVLEAPQAEPPFRPAHGHSKDHRPDLKQMVLSLATTGSAAFPVWMESHSGNASDKKVLQAGAARMHDFCKQLKNAPAFLYVGDSAFYERCVKEGVPFAWLSRVPERLNAAKKHLDLPDEQCTWIPLENGYSYTLLKDAGYGAVAQRWVMIHSEKAALREQTTLKKCIKKEQEAWTKVLWHLGNQSFQCQHDAEQAGVDAIKGLKYHTVTWAISPIEKHEKRGRPKKGTSMVTQGFSISGTLHEHTEAIELITRRKGRFILASNQMDEDALPNAQFLPEYKNQYKTEHGFAFIKGDTFEVASVFLKKPSRIEALMMVMTLCLMVYSFAQHYLRQALAEAQDTIPNQLGKPTDKPTMAWVFRIFHGIQVWVINQSSGVQELVVNLTADLRKIIRYFGPAAECIYASSG